jgi:carboxymethylenebutenolidase
VRRLISWIGLILLATGATPSPSRKPSTPAARPDEAKSAAGSTDTARVHLAPAGAGLDAFVAWPADRSAAPAVIVIHEWWGLNAQIREVAKRLAQQGYVAIVPDLYHGKVAGDPERAHELMRGLIDEVVMSDLDATIAWLRAEPRVGLRRIGIVGFCMGGRVAELFALHSPQVAAAVMFYGPPEVDPAKLATLRAPLQGHFGGEDQGIPPSRVEELKAGLAKAGKPVDIYVYAGAGHAFMNDSRPSYHADAARQAWARTLSFFQKNLKG